MESNKSLDESKLVIALLSDVQRRLCSIVTPRDIRLDQRKLAKRVSREGIGFLTKTLPHLGKALDSALTGATHIDSAKVGFKTQPSSKLPRFLGKLFNMVFSHDGRVLPTPCTDSIRALREVLYLFYKYELPYAADLNQNVIDCFKQTEKDILQHHEKYSEIASLLHADLGNWSRLSPAPTVKVLRRARRLLFSVFSSFDHTDIYPRHGPGAVATRERLWDKYQWTNVSDRITEVYPLDAYFYVSLGHVCDRLGEITRTTSKENSARVVLVPKDSRGPRLISCEPVDFQWIQQGLGRAIVERVESHWRTARRVNFTDQQPNQIAALFGSRNGRYVTLDLKEASDRVTVGLVRLLFPDPLLGALLACRSLSTELPDGEVLKLNKFAPMGSALCFPVLALTVWALLNGAAPDAYTRERILVYGDDVIVPAEFAENAMHILELFGLEINRNKSCTSGFFRESCGMDAYLGVPVTPVRIRTVWSSHPSPSVYTSWIAYANSLYDRRCFEAYDYIVSRLVAVYRQIPSDDMNLSCPSLRDVPVEHLPRTCRTNYFLQKREWKVRVVRSKRLYKVIDGWSMLLRYFAEGNRTNRYRLDENDTPRRSGMHGIDSKESEPFTAGWYTKRDSCILETRWR